MAKVILLCGKIASGKTTYANRLREEKGAILLSCDDLMLTLFDECLGPRHDDMLGRCYRYFYTLAEQIVESGLDAVLDFGYWTKQLREESKAYFSSRGMEARLCYIQCEEKNRLQRLTKRNEALAGVPHRVYLIHDELRERLDQKFEEPTDAEVDELIRM